MRLREDIIGTIPRTRISCAGASGWGKASICPLWAGKFPSDRKGWRIPARRVRWVPARDRETRPASAFEDTFFPYFFKHPAAFVDAGFIGFLAGKGLADDADYTHDNKDPQMGDKGWFFRQLKAFDKNRPYLTPTSGVYRNVAPGTGAAGSWNTDGRLHRVAGGWFLEDPAGMASNPAGSALVAPEVVNARGRLAAQVRRENSGWRIGLEGLEPGLYWLWQAQNTSLVLPAIR